MNTLPTDWCIEATKENFAELYPWWRANADKRFECFAIGHTLMSSHPDGSCYFSNCIERCIKLRPNYQPITIEQFRQITKPMNTLPQNWLIEVTEENQAELDHWRQQVATSHRENTLCVGYTLLSSHHHDGSHYYATTPSALRRAEPYYNNYQEITLEQFRQITNQTQKPMTKSIQISRELLNEYYEASTYEQKAYLAEHFKLDGTTTDEAIRGLHDLACGKWKPRIKKNHPECFEDGKYFDFSAMLGKAIVEPKVAQALGLSEDFIEVRNSSDPKANRRSFYLSTEYNWELVNDAVGMMVLIPTKK